MTRRSLLTLAFGRANSVDEFCERLLAHEKHYDPLIRKAFGCRPTGDMTPENCSTARRELSYGDFMRARKAAARLYGFKG